MIVNWDELCKDFQAIITWNSFEYDTSKSIKEHIDEYMLSEDLLQIILNEEDNIIFDVGWPDMFNYNASFIIYIIENYEWDNPKEKFMTNDIFKVIDILKYSLIKYSKHKI